MQPTPVDSRDLRTRFANKLGVYSPEDQTITWNANNGIRIVSYPKGRGSVLIYPQYEKGNYLKKMIANAKNAVKERGDGVFSQTFISGKSPLSQTFHWHIVIDPRLKPVVTSFTRFPQADSAVLTGEFDTSLENDLSTPYNSKLSKQMMQKVGLYLSSFGLPPNSYAVLHESIRGYFHSSKPDYSEWAKFADLRFLKTWADKSELMEGHPSLSTLAWATVSKFILGVPDDEFEDHAHIWNTLFQKNWDSLCETVRGSVYQHYILMRHLPKMEVYVLNKIRETQEKFDNNEEIPETIIKYWMQNNTARKAIKELPLSDLQQACQIAKNRNITIEEMFYLDNFFGVMIGMQENIAFILTQIAYCFAMDKQLAESCIDDISICRRVINQILKTLPPAGISRELRWDTDVLDDEKGKTYSANKGDQFITVPALTKCFDEYTESEEVNADRPPVDSQPFSDGPHKCPGQVPALGWLAAMTQQLAKYKFHLEVQEKPEFYLSFILRDGGMKFKMSHPGKLDESSSSEDDQLLTLMF